MRFQQKKLALALAHALGAAAFVVGVPVLAQTATPPADSKIKVDVVGSNIKRTLEDEALPVQVLTKDDIARSGVQNMEQLIQKISATASAGALSAATMAGTATYAQSSVSLRGLGANRTLVLVDGLRMTPFAQELASGVDINSIPISAIERVEVLTDGASSIYGSDAVAGVINFVLKRNYTGVTVGYEYDAPTRSGGGKTDNIWASVGYGDLTKDRFNVTLSYQGKKETALNSIDREFAKSGNVPPFLSNAATPSGRIEGIWVVGVPFADQQASASNPFGYNAGSAYGNPGRDSPGCAAMGMYESTGVPRAGTGKSCQFDSAAYLQLFPKSETQSGFGTFNFQINPQTQAYVTGLYTQNKVSNSIQANPARGSFFATDTAFEGSGVEPALLIYPTNPNYPHAWLQSHGLAAMDGQVLAVTSRAFAAGNRQEKDTNTQQLWVAGVKGNWYKDWDYDINGQWSESQSEGTVTGGYFSQVGFARAWNTVGNTAGSYVDPWSVGGEQPAALAAALLATNYAGPTATAKETLSSFNAKTTGNIYELPAGPVAMATGVTYMKQKYDIQVPDILLQGDISGLGGATLTQNGDRAVTSGFVEFNIPATKTLNFNLSGRVDHYDDLADEQTPVTGKLSATWQPTSWGMLRGSIGNGFRAPAMGELHKPIALGTSEQFIDPLFPADGPIQVNAFNGGNPLLVPEKSQQGSVGFVWTPAANFTGRIDYWAIKIDDYIIQPSALAMVNAARAGSFLFTPNEVTFNPDGGVATVNEVLQNAGKATFSGIDFGANWRIPSPWGTWGVDYAGSYYIKADLETQVATEHNVGTIVDQDQNPLTIPITGGVIARYKHNVALNWTYGPWGATLANNYITGYDTAPNQVDGAPHSVPSFTTWDVQASYSGFKYVNLVVGARNVFDTNPHLFIPTANQFHYGYDPAVYDPRGRVVYGRIVVAF